jgi:hypothetical protein
MLRYFEASFVDVLGKKLEQSQAAKIQALTREIQPVARRDQM